jgi:soluble lytic murein transglycosylase
LEFLLGFFNNNAAEFAPRYIRSLEKNLPITDLRVLAEALDNAGLYAESIRLVSLYSKYEDYTLDRRDLELLYPRPFNELIEQYAGETRLDPALLYGLIRTESAFQSGIVSQAGAVGLTQLIPATAEEMANRIRRSGGPNYFQTENGKAVLDLANPELNIHIGAFYTSYLADRFEDTLLAILAYNGGMNRVRRWKAASALPVDLFLETIEFRETREHGRRVMGAAAVYRELLTLEPAPEN